MLRARSQIFNNYNIRVLLVTAMVLLFCFQVRAQPNPNQPLRVLEYTDKVISGVAPAGSEIRLYYANPGTPCVKVGGTAPFKVIQAVVTNSWSYSTDMDAIGQFSAPVIVSYIKPGATDEILESRTLSRQEFQISPNDCSGVGTISMLSSFLDPAAVTWQNQKGEVVGSGTEIVNKPAGTYIMHYTNRHGCAYRSEPMTIGEATPIVDDIDIMLDCNEPSRAIQGQYTGTGVSFIWEKQDGTPLVSDRNITLFPGRYYFSVQNLTGCWSRKASVVVSSSSSAATINESGKDIGKADCGQRNGYIKGIVVATANNQPASYRWLNSEGALVGITLDMPDLPADVYTLEVYTPGSTCPVVLGNVEVEGLNAITLDIKDYVPHNTTCGMNNGQITGFKTNATSYRWLYINADGTETEVSTDLNLLNAAPGFYMLELKNNFNCTFRSRVFHVQGGEPAIALVQPPVIVADECNLGKGSIGGLNFNTRIKSYTWKDGLGNTLSESAELKNLRSGTYTLTVTTENCDASYTYTVVNNEASIMAPVMDDLQVCAASDVLLSFKETAAIYRIYDAGGLLLAERNDPNFRIKITRPGSYFAAVARGTCESPRTEFKIDFGASGLTIPSAFSPNGDGENDRWVIKGIDTYTDPEIKIFNRNGSLVYHTKGPSAPFDGKSKDADLPVGVYYYIVKISQVCPAETGSLTIIR